MVDAKFITYLPLNEVVREPRDGLWEILDNRWWSFYPGKGLMFYRKTPQCNTNEKIAQIVTSDCHPGAEVIFVPRVCLKHDCGDYI